MHGPRTWFGSVRGLLVLVLIFAIVCTVCVTVRNARLREARLIDELKAERTRAQAYQRLARMAIALPSPSVSELQSELARETDRFQAEAVRRRTSTEAYR